MKKEPSSTFRIKKVEHNDLMTFHLSKMDPMASLPDRNNSYVTYILTTNS